MKRYYVWVFALLMIMIGHPALANQLKTLSDFDAEEEERLTVIINLKSNQGNGNRKNGISEGWLNLGDYIIEAQAKLVDEMGWRNVNEIVALETLPVVGKSVTRSELEGLLASDLVESVYKSEEVEASLFRSGKAIDLPPVGPQYKGGKGYSVAVLDTSMDTNHPFIAGRVVGEACFTLFGQCPNGKKSMEGKGAAKPSKNCYKRGQCAHATHVAGIVGGKASDISGVAPEANIVAVRVLNDKSSRNVDLQILLGLEWVIKVHKQYNIAAVNMSLGGGGPYKSHCDRQAGGGNYAKLVKRLQDLGIVTVVATGNNARRNKRFLKGISVPACVSGVISVGATDNDGKHAAVYSNSASYVSIMAPGGDFSRGAAINSSVPADAGKLLQKNYPCSDDLLYCEFNGTSMAAPQVAGAWVALKSTYPKANFDQIKQALLSAPKFTDQRNGMSFPLLSIKHALAVLGGDEQKDTPKVSPKPKPGTEAEKKPESPKQKPKSDTQKKPAPEPVPPAPQERIDGIFIDDSTTDEKIRW